MYSLGRMISLALTILSLTACGDGGETTYGDGLIVGDSIMASLPITTYQGVRMENLAQGGTHCVSAVDILVSAGPRDTVILGCGHNGFVPDLIKVQIERAIEHCRMNCRQLVLVNINPVLKYADKTPERLAQTIELNAWIDEMGETHNIQILDFFSWSMANQTTEMFYDTLHPTPLGYEYLVSEVFGE